MSHPLPPLFNIISALSESWVRRPSEAPASALWLYRPTIYKPSLDEREANMQVLLEWCYEAFEPETVAQWRKEAAGKLPSEELAMFSDRM